MEEIDYPDRRFLGFPQPLPAEYREKNLQIGQDIS
jgi:hypothetical protein